jgi:hypothetical protein
MKITKLTLIAAATVAASIALTACSASTPKPGPTTIAAPTPAPTNSSAPAEDQGSCQVNPATAPMPSAERLEVVPEPGRISVTLSGIPSGTVTPGAAPTEVDVTLCNNSAVSYPKVGVVLALEHCSCTTSPTAMPKGTVERFDPATGGWIPVDYPVMGTGMDYVLAWNNEQAQPLRHRQPQAPRGETASDGVIHSGQRILMSPGNSAVTGTRTTRRNSTMSTSKITKLALITTATAAAAIVLPATANADFRSSLFESPVGDVVCEMSTGDDGTGDVFCDVDSLQRPPYPSDCPQGWAYRFGLDQGNAPISHCNGGETIIPGSIPRNRALDTLAYGQTRSAGTLTCDSEAAGVTCTDSSTGHFFRASHESYQLG